MRKSSLPRPTGYAWRSPSTPPSGAGPGRYADGRLHRDRRPRSRRLRRRPAPVARDDLQERPRRASTTAAARASSSATPTTKPAALLHAYGRLVASLGGRVRDRGRRRHDRRGHGRHRRGVPLDHGPLAGATAGSATRGSSPRSGCSRACAPAPSTSGARRPGAGAGSASCGVGKVGGRLIGPPRRRRGRGRRGRSGAEAVARPCAPSTRRRVRRSSSDALVDRALDMLSPERPRRTRSPTSSCARITARLGVRRRQQPAGRPGRGGDLLAERGILYAPGLPGQLRRGHPGGRGARRLRPGPGPGAHGPGLRHHPAGARPGAAPRASPRSWRPSGWPRSGSPGPATADAGIAGHSPHRLARAGTLVRYRVSAGWAANAPNCPLLAGACGPGEGVEPWGAAVRRPSRPRLPAS